MKKFIGIFAILVAFSGASVLAEEPVEREVSIGVNDVFVPAGFDANSDVTVIASGLFPNGCYRWSRAVTNRAANGLTVVQTKAIVREGMCLMVLVPYTKEIGIGKLGAGTHKVRFENGDGTYLERKIVIE